jgi:hypothetical protein
VYSFDKFAFKWDAGLGNYQISIPGRDMGAVTLESDGVGIDISAGAAAAWVTAFVTIAVGDNGANADAVLRGFVLK